MFQGYPVLWPFGSGQAGHDRGKIQFDDTAIRRFRHTARAEHTLFLRVGFDQRDLGVRATRESQIFQCFLVYRKNTAGGAVFRCHVRDRGAIRQGQVFEAVAEKLDKFTDDTVLAQYFNHGQHQVGCRGAFRQRAGQAESDYLGYQHRNRLSQHRGLSLDATDTPTEYAKAVNHRGMGIGTDQGIRISLRYTVLFFREYHAREILKIHLVHNPGVRWDDLEIGKGLLSPFQKTVAFAVTLVFQIGIKFHRVLVAEFVNLHRVVDDQFGRLQRVDFLRVSAQHTHRITHRSQVDNRGHAGKILHQDTGGCVGDFAGRCSFRIPVGQCLDILGGHAHAVFMT